MRQPAKGTEQGQENNTGQDAETGRELFFLTSCKDGWDLGDGEKDPPASAVNITYLLMRFRSYLSD